MRAPARGTVFEHNRAQAFELASSLRAALPIVVALAYLVLSAIDLDLLGPIGWPRFRLGLCALALAIVLPLALALPFAFALTFVLPFALALSWAIRVPNCVCFHEHWTDYLYSMV